MKPTDYTQWIKGGIVHIVSKINKRWKTFYTHCGFVGRVEDTTIIKNPASGDICEHCLRRQMKKVIIR